MAKIETDMVFPKTLAYITGSFAREPLAKGCKSVLYHTPWILFHYSTSFSVRSLGSGGG